MEDENESPRLKCSECRKTINYGADAITTEVCVNGPRGLVTLGDRQIFCSEACLSQFYGDADLSELHSAPPRIP